MFILVLLLFLIGWYLVDKFGKWDD